MRMMRTTILIILWVAIGAGYPLSAQNHNQEIDLQALYQQIDKAIEQSPQFVSKRLEEIADSYKQLQSEQSMEKRLALAERLFDLYHAYRNDSALYYAGMCISLADSLHRKDIEGLYLSRKAHQCSNAGLHVEALDLLKRVDKSALGPKELTNYYGAWMHVCGEIGSSSQQPDVRQSYYVQQDSYRDSVLMVAEKGSEEYLHLKMDVFCARQLYQDALGISDNWLSHVEEGTHSEAFADIKCAVFDQASLFMLAECLAEDGDYDRAYRYVRFCEKCNTEFLPRLRSYQVRYVANVLEAAYSDSQARYSRLLTIACVGALLLLGVVVWLLLRLRRPARHHQPDQSF